MHIYDLPNPFDPSFVGGGIRSSFVTPDLVGSQVRDVDEVLNQDDVMNPICSYS
jgi:hypothetical protein